MQTRQSSQAKEVWGRVKGEAAGTRHSREEEDVPPLRTYNGRIEAEPEPGHYARRLPRRRPSVPVQSLSLLSSPCLTYTHIQQMT